MSQIEVKGVCKYYETKAGKVAALKDINFQVDEGEFVGIVGKSGSGKSTLINMLAGIDRPSEGSVCVSGQYLESMTEDGIARLRGAEIGIVFQFFQLLPVLSVLENILLPMDFLNRIPAKARMDRAFEILKLVDMTDYAYKLPSELSGGMQQKAAIARSLANDPPIIIADEPTGNLDSLAAGKIVDLFESLKQRKKTVVMVTHDDEMARRASRIISIKDGEIIGQVFNSPERDGEVDETAQ